MTRLLDLAEKSAPLNKVLDAACGTGRISKLLCERGYDLTCSDISDEMLAMAKDRLKGTEKKVIFQKADIYDLPFAAEQFDCSEDQVRNHIASGALEAVNIGGGTVRKSWRITDAAIEAFIASRTHAPQPKRRTSRHERPVTEWF